MEIGSKNQLIVQMPGEAAGATPLPGNRRAPFVVLTTAELAECTCPEFCERDHDVD
jgi:hypothetical protein